MNIDLIPIGDNPPNSVNVVIEVPVGGEPSEVRVRQEVGRVIRGSNPAYADALPGELWFFIPHTVRPMATRSMHS